MPVAMTEKSESGPLDTLRQAQGRHLRHPSTGSGIAQGPLRAGTFDTLQRPSIWRKEIANLRVEQAS